VWFGSPQQWGGAPILIAGFAPHSRCHPKARGEDHPTMND
jgi:hypothetical protein